MLCFLRGLSPGCRTLFEMPCRAHLSIYSQYDFFIVGDLQYIDDEFNCLFMSWGTNKMKQIRERCYGRRFYYFKPLCSFDLGIGGSRNGTAFNREFWQKVTFRASLG